MSSFIDDKMREDYINKYGYAKYFGIEKPNELSFNDKRTWLKNNVDYSELIEYALSNVNVINILYDKFKK